ncbi:MAG TPA: homocysteine S-methyltransferase family protein [Candidatus Limnocylindrales bacterium]
MTEGLLDRLGRGPVLGDGGYLLELEKRGYVQAGPFTPEVSITNPEALAQLHREFLRAGAEILQALTFYASEEKLATVGLAGRVDDINRAAVRVARSVADEGDALVAGNLSLTWAFDPADPASADRVRALFDRQLEVQMDEGIDLVIGETFSYLGEALIALERAKLTGLPTVITMSFEDSAARAYEGDDPGDCARKLVDAGADVVGINCLRDPERTLPLAKRMLDAVPGAWVATQPVAYRVTEDKPDFTAWPEFPFALEHLALARGEMADYAVRARDLGVRLIGSCCGSVANHVRAMAKALGKLPPEERAWRSTSGKAMSAYEYHGHTEVEVAR